MSYAAQTRERQTFVAQGSNLPDILRSAIEYCAEVGTDIEVVDIHTGKMLYDVEADTKVDDDAPFYPAIVHKCGAQDG